MKIKLFWHWWPLLGMYNYPEIKTFSIELLFVCVAFIGDSDAT